MLTHSETQPLALSANEHTEERSAARFKIFQPAKISADGVQHRGHVLNVSATGAMVHAVLDVVVGSLIRICVTGLDRRAIVTWKNASIIGVRFTRSISSTQIETMRQDVEKQPHRQAIEAAPISLETMHSSSDRL